MKFLGFDVRRHNSLNYIQTPDNNFNGNFPFEFDREFVIVYGVNYNHQGKASYFTIYKGLLDEEKILIAIKKRCRQRDLRLPFEKYFGKYMVFV
jgi:hypothetical protein